MPIKLFVDRDFQQQKKLYIYIYIYICRVTVFWLGLVTDGNLGPADPVQ